MGAVRELADLIVRLSGNREDICAKSLGAMQFAEKHNYESVFDLRIEHCARALHA
jgi:hypothetical protein